MEILGDLDRWNAAAPGEQGEVIAAVAAGLGQEFRLAGSASFAAYGCRDLTRIFFLDHVPTGMTFNVIPGGRYVPGISPGERSRMYQAGDRADIAVFEELLPPAAPGPVTVSPFLCSRFPVLDGQAASLIDLEELAGRPEFFDPDLDSDDEEALDAAMDAVPVYLTLAEIQALLARTGFRLMSEAEAEYAIRARTTSLFWFGDTMADRDLGSVCLASYADSERNRQASNGFGLVGVAAGTICASPWHARWPPATPGPAPAPDTAIQLTETYAYRGGAAICWPFQSSEWGMLISAMRYPHTSVYNSMAGVRLARPLPHVPPEPGHE